MCDLGHYRPEVTGDGLVPAFSGMLSADVRERLTCFARASSSPMTRALTHHRRNSYRNGTFALV